MYDYKERYLDARKKWLKDIWNTPYEIPCRNNKDMSPVINGMARIFIRNYAKKQNLS